MLVGQDFILQADFQSASLRASARRACAALTYSQSTVLGPTASFCPTRPHPRATGAPG
ncbi:conserved hypothetical protein [Candidatus Sulfopaludibacter sp. SbA4]|nr:conserved hypothetical protein [Candidatus Sulfopaludibacter sp. SbA4]